MNENPPISHEDLRSLFEHLEQVSGTGYECDHTFALTREFLQKKKLPVEPMLQWLGENGAGCDCEVMFNTEQEWGEVVGYEPLDDDD